MPNTWPKNLRHSWVNRMSSASRISIVTANLRSIMSNPPESFPASYPEEEPSSPEEALSSLESRITKAPVPTAANLHAALQRNASLLVSQLNDGGRTRFVLTPRALGEQKGMILQNLRTISGLSDHQITFDSGRILLKSPDGKETEILLMHPRAPASYQLLVSNLIQSTWGTQKSIEELTGLQLLSGDPPTTFVSSLPLATLPRRLTGEGGLLEGRAFQRTPEGTILFLRWGQEEGGIVTSDYARKKRMPLEDAVRTYTLEKIFVEVPQGVRKKLVDAFFRSNIRPLPGLSNTFFASKGFSELQNLFQDSRADLRFIENDDKTVFLLLEGKTVAKIVTRNTNPEDARVLLENDTQRWKEVLLSFFPTRWDWNQMSLDERRHEVRLFELTFANIAVDIFGYPVQMRHLQGLNTAMLGRFAEDIYGKTEVEQNLEERIADIPATFGALDSTFATDLISPRYSNMLENSPKSIILTVGQCLKRDPVKKKWWISMEVTRGVSGIAKTARGEMRADLAKFVEEFFEAHAENFGDWKRDKTKEEQEEGTFTRQNESNRRVESGRVGMPFMAIPIAHLLSRRQLKEYKNNIGILTLFSTSAVHAHQDALSVYCGDLARKFETDSSIIKAILEHESLRKNFIDSAIEGENSAKGGVSVVLTLIKQLEYIQKYDIVYCSPDLTELTVSQIIDVLLYGRTTDGTSAFHRFVSDNFM